MASLSARTELDEVLWSHILHFLRAEDCLFAISRSNREINRIVNSGWLWHQWFCYEYPLSPPNASDDTIPWRITYKRRSMICRWARDRMTLKKLPQQDQNILVTTSPTLPSANRSPTLPSLNRSQNRRHSGSPQSSVSFLPRTPTYSPTLSPSLYTPRRPIVFKYPTTKVTSMRLHDKTVLIGNDNSIRIFSVDHSAGQLGHIRAGHPVSCLDHSPAVIISGGRDCTMRWYAWDTLDQSRISTKREGHADTPTDISLTKDGRRFCSVGFDGKLKQWNVETGHCEHTWGADVDGSGAQGQLHAGLMYCMYNELNDWGCIVGSRIDDSQPSSGSGCVSLWDRRTMNGTVEVIATDCELICSVSEDADSHIVAAGGSDGIVRLYDRRKFTHKHCINVSPPVSPIDSAFASNVPTAPIQSSPPSKSYISSLHINGGRLLTTQPGVFTTFQSSPHPITTITGLPHTHPVHSFTIDNAATLIRSSSPQNLQSFHRSDYECVQKALAIAMSDVCLVWTNDDQYLDLDLFSLYQTPNESEPRREVMTNTPKKSATSNKPKHFRQKRIVRAAGGR